jgi:HEAT repeat protein
LKAFGAIQDIKTRKYRVWILRRCLFSESLYVRDAATIGLSLALDTDAFEDLKNALEKEKAPLLKVLMKQVLDELSQVKQ